MRPRPPTARHRLAAGAVLAIAAVLGAAGRASADPARPTNYRSVVVHARPGLPAGVTIRVVGGDAFLELQVAHGHTAVVPDYEQAAGVAPPPYLRFLADGTVERNERSFATALNRGRYGGDVSKAQPDRPPRWKVVGHQGTYLWHDHRIHWMSPVRPATVAGRRRVDMGGPDGLWAIDLVVDGRPVTIEGELELLAPPSPIPWFAVVGLATVVLLGLSWSTSNTEGSPDRIVGIGLAMAATGALGVAVAERHAIPVEAGGSVILLVLPTLALLAALGGLAARSTRTRRACIAGSVATLATWSVRRIPVLSHAVLPTSIPYALDRAATAVAMGAGLAATAVLLWRPDPGCDLDEEERTAEPEAAK